VRARTLSDGNPPDSAQINWWSGCRRRAGADGRNRRGHSFCRMPGM